MAEPGGEQVQARDGRWWMGFGNLWVPAPGTEMGGSEEEEMEIMGTTPFSSGEGGNRELVWKNIFVKINFIK